MAVQVKTKAETPPKEEILEDQTPEEFENFGQEDNFKILEPRKMPDFPAKNIEVNKTYLFFEWQDLLVEEDWNHLILYLFREWPVIDRTRVNPKATINIEVIGSKLDIRSKSFLENHGSGKYKLLVNDNNKAVKGKGGTIGIVRFQVDDPNYPPVFVLEELIPEHPSNRSITAKLVAEGKLNLEGKVMQNQGGNNPSTDPAMVALLSRLIDKVTTEKPAQSKDATMDAVIQILTKTNDQSLQTLRDQIKGDSPDKTVQLIAAMKELMPKHESENSTLALIVKMQGDMAKVQADSQSSRESLMLKMMEMMNQKKEGEDDFDKQIDRQIKLKELFGGGEGGNGRKPSIPELLIEHGAPVVLKVLETVQGFVNIRNYQAGLARQQQQPGPIENQAPAIEPIQEQPKEKVEEKGNVIEMQTPEQQLIQVIKFAGGSIIGALQRGVTGDVFAESIEVQNGKIAYDQIASAGKDKILEAMKAVPEFWSQVVPDSVEKFVSDFIDYGKEEEGEEE